MSNPTTDDVPWLDHEEWRTWMAVAGLLEVIPSSLDSQLREDAGINMFEYMMLAGLSIADDHTRPLRELAVYVSGSASRMTHATNRLVDRGWVVRVPHPEGRRSLQLHLTDAGMTALEAAAPAHVRHVRRLLFDVLTTDQMLELGRIARLLVEHNRPELATMLRREAAGPTR